MALLCLVSVVPTLAQEEDEVVSGLALRVFLDCRGFRYCNRDFYLREIPYVNHTRDREDAEVHVLVTSETTGAGGQRFTLDFIGRSTFEGVDDRLEVSTRANLAEEQVMTRLARRIQPFLQTDADEFHPTLSPDGRWMAYVSDVSGRWEVYVAPYPGPGARVQVSTEGGSEPFWSPDGRTLYYRSLGERQIARQMMAVSLRPEALDQSGSLQIEKPRVLFDGPFFQCSEGGRSYDLSPDGDRFLMIHDQRPGLTATQINVVVNWFAELELH